MCIIFSFGRLPQVPDDPVAHAIVRGDMQDSHLS
jgi:hypothetical protein